MNAIPLTPLEAALKAENERLRMQLDWLVRAMGDKADYVVTPTAVVETLHMDRQPPERVLLSSVIGIRGQLLRDNRYHVIGQARHPGIEDLVVHYYADAVSMRDVALYQANELFPMLHRKFVASLVRAMRERE